MESAFSDGPLEGLGVLVPNNLSLGLKQNLFVGLELGRKPVAIFATQKDYVVYDHVKTPKTS